MRFVKRVRQEHTHNNKDKALSVFHDLVVNQQQQQHRVKFERIREKQHISEPTDAKTKYSHAYDIYLWELQFIISCIALKSNLRP